MSFLLSKLLPMLLFPIGSACLLGLAAAALAFAGKPRAAGIAALTGSVILYLASLSPVSQVLLRGLEGRFPQLPTYPKSPAIVVLGGSGEPAVPPRRYPETNIYGDRLSYGALLFRQGLAPRIVVTGGVISLFTDVAQTEASVDADILEDYFGIDPGSIVLADESRNTHEDALCVRKRFEALGLPKEIILVTSAAHMPRSVALFRKQGFAVHPAPADFHARAGWHFKPLNFLPDEGALFNTCFALHEYLGYAVYKALGWI
jgi:uncharacterized SAM-binding protein YcdF (DUF218 family)